MTNKPLKGGSGLILALALAGSTALTGCVDHDYDLSKDMDLKVTLGGKELHLPVSNTDVLTMREILDIDPQSSSIKTDREGNYSLVQKGSDTYSRIDIDRQTLDVLNGDRTSTLLAFNLIAGSTEAVTPTGDIVSNLSIEDHNVDPALKSLSQADTDLEMTVNVTYSSSTFNGTARLKSGFKVEFAKGWTVEPIGAAAGYLTNDSHNVLRFTRDVDFSTAGFTIRVKVTHFNLGPNRGEGLYEVGHFLLNSDIVFNGDMAILNSGNRNGQENVSLITDTRVTKAELLTVTGCVDPEIDVNPTSVEITDIPDFLTEEGNNLDVANPQIYLTVRNTSPVTVNVNARLTAYTESGATTTVGVGEAYGTNPIVIAPEGTTVIGLCRTGTPDRNDAIPVRVPDLGNLLTTIPRSIGVSDVEARADQTREVTFVLGAGANYEFATGYEAIVPFTFGENLRFTYTDGDDEWDNEDFDKYNFSRVNISTTVVNSSPLTLSPSVVALDREGNEIPNITATVEGTVAGGSLSAPASTPLKVTLLSTGENISNLSGVRFSFEATMDKAHVGEYLNENQSVRFNDIQVSISGGITIDLND